MKQLLFEPSLDFSMKQGQGILMTDKEYSEVVETAFAPLSGVAFESARAQALESGQSVLQTERGKLYRIYPDGRKEFVKFVPDPVAVTPGQKVFLG